MSTNMCRTEVRVGRHSSADKNHVLFYTFLDSRILPVCASFTHALRGFTTSTHFYYIRLLLNNQHLPNRFRRHSKHVAPQIPWIRDHKSRNVREMICGNVRATSSNLWSMVCK